jgi:glycosyltransferase involved in cell wall biosynthesis
MKVSIIIPCKNRLKHLKMIFKEVLRQDYTNIEIIVVDYRCPQGTSDHIKQNFKDERIKIVEAEVGADEWNLSAARNLGFKKSTGELLLFIDADTQLHHKFVGDCVNRIREGVFLSGKHNPDQYSNSGCCMVRREDFIKVRGYNEVVEGWGTEDLDLYERLGKEGIVNEYFNFAYIRNIPHDNSVRNMYHGNKDIYETNSKNWERVRNEFKGL